MANELKIKIEGGQISYTQFEKFVAENATYSEIHPDGSLYEFPDGTALRVKH